MESVSIHKLSPPGMFDDPPLFRCLRSVADRLRTYPFLRVWVAGCGSGEEVYSLAVMLEEDGLLNRTTIYGTDTEEESLRVAREGVFPLSRVEEFSRNYESSGGRRSLSDYFSTSYDKGTFRGRLKENLVFARHDLATDGSFNEFHLILCRGINVTIRDRAHEVLFESLCRFGLLGGMELESTPHAREYERVEAGVSLFRRIG